MILSLAALAGWFAGQVRAQMGNRPYRPISLRHMWLVFLATLPQIGAFYFPSTRHLFSSQLAASVLVGSQLLLAIFASLNLRQPGLWLSGLGLGLNLTAIISNGGLMPVSPKTVHKLWPEAPEDAIEPGQHIQGTKDIILLEEKTKFSWLSDRFVTPSFLPTRYAFSLGDCVIAAGVFLFLWTLGGPIKKQ